MFRAYSIKNMKKPFQTITFALLASLAAPSLTVPSPAVPPLAVPSLTAPSLTVSSLAAPSLSVSYSAAQPVFALGSPAYADSSREWQPVELVIARKFIGRERNELVRRLQASNECAEVQLTEELLTCYKRKDCSKGDGCSKENDGYKQKEIAHTYLLSNINKVFQHKSWLDVNMKNSKSISYTFAKEKYAERAQETFQNFITHYRLLRGG